MPRWLNQELCQLLSHGRWGIHTFSWDSPHSACELSSSLLYITGLIYNRFNTIFSLFNQYKCKHIHCTYTYPITSDHVHINIAFPSAFKLWFVYYTCMCVYVCNCINLPTASSGVTSISLVYKNFKYAS